MSISKIDLYPVYSLCFVFALGLEDKLLEDVVIAGNNAGKKLCQQLISHRRACQIWNKIQHEA